MTAPGSDVTTVDQRLGPDADAAAKVSARRRRPTGAPAPLPHDIGVTGRLWLGVLAVLLGGALVALKVDAVYRQTEVVDAAVLRTFASVRTPWLERVASGLNNTFAGYEMTFLSVALLIAVAIFRRWRHLFVLIATIAITGFVGGQLDSAFSRPRPYDVTIIGDWEGFAMPSLSSVILVNLLLGIAYTMVPAGTLRTLAKWCTAVIVTAVGAAGLYLGVDHPSDVVVAVALSVAVSLVMFRTFTPNETFPVHYRGGKTAHLDVGGVRGQAIRQSIRDQLGFMVKDVRHVGLAGSGGSTPLRLTVSSDSDYYLFAKLYAMSHVRADRWYKLGRTILYGRLEDEAPFQSVRRLVEYEDYAARVLRDNGIPTADSFGIVEITPEREYILVTEFFDGAQEISDAPVDDRVIDNALIIVRRLWDAGLAHRDIKPANLLVRDGQVFLIDAFFVQVRPSPWRQAIDLANMMLVLALRTDAERVYEHALRYFTEDEIAEAFAATRGVASPTQLRAVMKRDGRDLVSEFRALAPARAPVTLQRWSVLRVLLAVGVLAGAALSAVQVVNLLQPRTDAVGRRPSCGTDDVIVLMAQAVPEATMVPCIGAIPAGWTLDETHIASNRASFSLNSDTAGPSAVEAILMPRADCDVSDAVPSPSDEPGTERFEDPQQLEPLLRLTRYYLFDGGCVQYRLRFASQAMSALLFQADQILAFQSRSSLVVEVHEDAGLRLCGVGVACPEGW
jgi:tRNA A-37 threonylcarbamoyl transferase component Bud32